MVKMSEIEQKLYDVILKLIERQNNNGTQQYEAEQQRDLYSM